MAWYAIYTVATGALVSVGSVVANPLPPGVAALALPGEPDTSVNQWNTETLAFEPRNAGPESWTKYQFKCLLTAAERIAIRAAALADPVIADFMDLLSDSGEVQRNNPNVAAALAYMESIGLLAPGRAVEILNG